MYTLACSILNDHPEACMGLGIKDSCVTNAPCCGCLTPCEHMQDISAAARFPVRDMHIRAALEAAIQDGDLALELYRRVAVDDAAPKRSKGDERSYAKQFVKELYELMSAKPGGSAYDSFPWLEGAYVMLAANIDWLHVINLGIIRRALILTAWHYEKNRQLCTKTRGGGCAELNARLAGRGGAHDGERRHVPDGLFYRKLKQTGREKVKLKAGLQGGQIGEIACHMIYVTRDADLIARFWVALCEWRDALYAHTHSFDSVLNLRRRALAYPLPCPCAPPNAAPCARRPKVRSSRALPSCPGSQVVRFVRCVAAIRHGRARHGEGDEDWKVARSPCARPRGDLRGRPLRCRGHWKE